MIDHTDEQDELNTRIRPPLRFYNMGLFHTPESVQEIHDWIGKLSGGERIAAWTVFGMLVNLVAERGVDK